MKGDMAAGFLQGAGVDPGRMKAFCFVIVFALFFSFAAWVAKKTLEAYMAGELEKNEAIKSCVILAVTVVTLLVFITWF